MVSAWWALTSAGLGFAVATNAAVLGSWCGGPPGAGQRRRRQRRAIRTAPIPPFGHALRGRSQARGVRAPRERPSGPDAAATRRPPWPRAARPRRYRNARPTSKPPGAKPWVRVAQAAVIVSAVFGPVMGVAAAGLARGGRTADAVQQAWGVKQASAWVRASGCPRGRGGCATGGRALPVPRRQTRGLLLVWAGAKRALRTMDPSFTLPAQPKPAPAPFGAHRGSSSSPPP
jgi:hypothetical protein